LHEFTARGALFQPLADLLAALGWKVVAPDMPGRGQSQRLPSELYTWRSYVDVLAAVLRLHSAAPLVILGVGWGAMLGLGLENLWRPKPAKLILCDLPLNWQFATDARTLLMGQLCKIVAQNDDDFMIEARRLASTTPDIAADVLGLIAPRLTGPEGARSLGTDPNVFNTLPRDPNATFSNVPLLRACSTPTEMLYRQGAAASEQDGFPLSPFVTTRRIAGSNFYDWSERTTLLAVCDAINFDLNEAPSRATGEQSS
jgi:pimeloyl-ACP methyl ester carboxylesterase